MPGNEREKIAPGGRAASAWSGFTCNAMRTSSGGRVVEILPAPWATPTHYSALGGHDEVGRTVLTRCTH